jgi:hypothetical protein
MLTDLFFSLVFHLRKADDIKALQCMSAMRRIAKNANIVVFGKAEERWVVVG